MKRANKPTRHAPRELDKMYQPKQRRVFRTRVLLRYPDLLREEIKNPKSVFAEHIPRLVKKYNETCEKHGLEKIDLSGTPYESPLDTIKLKHSV